MSRSFDRLLQVHHIHTYQPQSTNNDRMFMRTTKKNQIRIRTTGISIYIYIYNIWYNQKRRGDYKKEIVLLSLLNIH